MKYRKKPVVIEAIQINESTDLKNNFLKKFFEDGVIFENIDPVNRGIYIKTLEGDLKVSKGDYIIKGVKDEIYPCKPDIFKMTYEKVENSEGTWESRLAVETKELSEKVNKLHTYMATDGFYKLPREDKDLLYAQETAMMQYLQVLGKRCELHRIDLSEKEIDNE